MGAGRGGTGSGVGGGEGGIFSARSFETINLFYMAREPIYSVRMGSDILQVGDWCPLRMGTDTLHSKD